MAVPVLIITPNTKFGTLIHRLMDNSGIYRSFVVGESKGAIERARRMNYVLAAIDVDLENKSALTLGQALQDVTPGIKIIYITSRSNTAERGLLAASHTPLATLDSILESVDALLNKQVELPPESELAGSVTEESHWYTLSEQVDRTVSLPGDANSSWRDHPHLASRWLDKIIRDSGANSLLLIHKDQLWGYAGKQPRTMVDDFCSMILQQWQRKAGIPKEIVLNGKNEYSYAALQRDEMVRYVHSESENIENILYARYLCEDFLLALAYDIRTPLSLIRSQAVRVAEVLITSPTIEQIEPSQVIRRSDGSPILHTDNPRQPVIDNEDGQPLEQAVSILPHSERNPLDEIIVPMQPGYNTAQASGTPSDATMEGGNQWNQPEEQAHKKSKIYPRLTKEEPVAALLPAVSFSSIWCEVSYACVLLPRLPWHKLKGDLSTRLTAWMRHLGLVYAYRIDYMTIRPDYVHWVCHARSDMSIDTLIGIVRIQTSERIFNEYPRLAEENPAGEFWMPGYLALCSQKPVANDLIDTYIEQMRRWQGADPFDSPG